jgi:hypothetical protein
MPVLMPLADGHHIPWPVLTGLMRQSLDVAVRPCSRPAEAHRRHGEALSRNALLATVKTLPPGNVVAMMDRDVQLLDAQALESACVRLASDAGLKVVHLRYKTGPLTHYDMGCIVFRSDLAKVLEFDPTIETCHCGTLTRCLDEHGWRQDYLSEECEGREYIVYNGG